MDSIKLKLFLAVSGLIILYVLLSWLLNSQFLVKYYYANKENTLKENYEHLNEIYQGKPFDMLIDLEIMERTESLHIIVFDTWHNAKYNSSFKEEDLFNKPTKPPRFAGVPFIPETSIIEKANKVTRDNPIIFRSTDRRLNSEFINLIGVLNNGDYVFISTPVIAIEESAAIANKFFLATGLFTIITGLVIIFLFSGRFTKPILELNGIAQRMAKLDFSRKYPVKSSDEIGELGQSINSLSEHLEKSITELRQANEKLLEDIERERKIDDMRKEFISNVSHELKTPISLIQGYAEGLKVNVNENEEDKNFYCEVIID
jgi:methyl-accepting chemotaxis protein